MIRRTEVALFAMMDAAQKKHTWPQRCDACGGAGEHVMTCPVIDQLVAPLCKRMDDIDRGANDGGNWREKRSAFGVTQEMQFRYILRTIYSPDDLPRELRS